MESGVKIGRAIVSSIIPPVGIITWATIKDKRPKNAKVYLALGLIFFGTWTVSSIVYYATKDK